MSAGGPCWGSGDWSFVTFMSKLHAARWWAIGRITKQARHAIGFL
jgi:hypothetical protein